MDPGRDAGGTLSTFEVTRSAIECWLVRLWWATAALDGLVLIASIVLPASDFPLSRVTPLIAASALVNAETAARVGRGSGRSRWISGTSVLLHVALLTALLELSGGPSNPFSVIYAVQIALAALTLGSRWAALTALASIAGYGLLIAWHIGGVVPANHRFVDFPTHLFTMWLAIASLAELAAHFAGMAAGAIERRERELDEMRAQAARAEHLMAVTTLAAGAAHELSTPLATIAIASKEMERTLAALTVPADCAADAHLIREEVTRCQLILDQMTGRAGGSAAEQPQAVGIDALLADLQSRLPADLAARLETSAVAGLPAIVVPRAGLMQVLLSLIRNAFDATDGPEPVRLAVESERGMFRFVIRDEGHGMSPETLRRAGEPFYTTKTAGRGFGLGLFLARMFAERCGGSLSLRSDRGITAILHLPASPSQAEI